MSQGDMNHYEIILTLKNMVYYKYKIKMKFYINLIIPFQRGMIHFEIILIL